METELYNWLKVHYRNWLRFIEASSALAKKEDLARKEVVFPFTSFLKLPALAFCCFMRRLLLDNFGKDASMLTVLVEDETGRTPYILYEEISDGFFRSYKLFNDKTENEVKGILANEGKVVAYVKKVHISLLKEIMEKEKAFSHHDSRARFLIDLIFLALENLGQRFRIEPTPPFLQNLIKILKDDIQLSWLVFTELAKNRLKSAISSNLPSIKIITEKGNLGILIPKRSISITMNDSFLFGLIDCLSSSENLKGLYGRLITFVWEGVKDGEISWKWGWLKSRLIDWWIRKKVRRLPEKLYVLARIMADPFRLMVVSGERALLFQFDEGLLSKVWWYKIEDPNMPLKEVWLDYCKNHQFIHLSFYIPINDLQRIEEGLSLGRISLKMREPIEFYPKNQFVQYLSLLDPVSIAQLLLPFAVE
ncbi:MAG: hypothetical protein V2A53_02870 [bacterium]